MTQDNYNYRTNQLFLRNQFADTGKYGIPVVPKAIFSDADFENLRLLGFDKVKSDNGKHANRIVHFFLYDYEFESVWEEPEASIASLQKYRAVLTPDFSMYTEMPDAMLLYNVFRNRWCGAYFASRGLHVIPTVNWGTESSFDYCFEGVEKGSAVAVSTYMVQEKEGREPQTEFFMSGYNEMLRRIEPETIICYHEPFPEMRGNIIYVNYELSSWRHVNDDIVTENKQSAFARKQNTDTNLRAYMIPGYNSEPIDNNNAYRVGLGDYYVHMGSGSAYGGKWKPKKPADERYLGEAGEIKTTFDEKGHRVDTKIGDDGKAVMERHYTNAPNPKHHSNPHDHIINWGPSENPIPSPPINYWDGDVPAFKATIGVHYMERVIKANGTENNAFNTIAEFQSCIRDGGEVMFLYNKREYGISPKLKRIPESNYQICISEINNDDSEAWYDDSEHLLDYIIDGKKLREIIKEVTVTYRTI